MDRKKRDGVRGVCVLAVLMCFALLAGPSFAALIQPTAVGPLYIPPGSNNTAMGRDGTVTKPYIDDAFLTSISFGTVTFTAAKSEFRAVKEAFICEKGVEQYETRKGLNAEFGDYDDGADGHHNPFVRAGVHTPPPDIPPDAIRQSVDPAVQDPAIAAAFGDLSLVECIDGEGQVAFRDDYNLHLMFESPIVDNDNAPDGCPEVIFFERGGNSDFKVYAIIGGTVTDPTWVDDPAPFAYVTSADLTPTGICIDTYEIPDAQELVAVGIDLNDLGIDDGTPIIGVKVQAMNTSGPDLVGVFLSSPSNGEIPEPGSAVLIVLGAAGALARLRRRR